MALTIRNALQSALFIFLVAAVSALLFLGGQRVVNRFTRKYSAQWKDARLAGIIERARTVPHAQRAETVAKGVEVYARDGHLQVTVTYVDQDADETRAIGVTYTDAGKQSRIKVAAKTVDADAHERFLAARRAHMVPAKV